MSLELVIYTKEDAFLKAVEFNFDELKNEVSNRCEHYKGLVFTNETIPEAKADRATLNKVVAALETQRKEIKKRCLAPYEAFETKIKELVDIVNQPISEIDNQIKAFEESQKTMKHGEIVAYWTENAKDLADLLDFNKVFNSKWLNSTVKIDAVFKEIDAIFEKTRNDLKVIGDLKTSFILQVKDKYLQTLDLSAALAENNRLEERDSQLKAYEAKCAETKAMRPVEQAKPEQKKVVEEQKPELKQDPVLEVNLCIKATRVQMQVLKTFLEDHKISYSKI